MRNNITGGVIACGNQRSFVMADIPGLIEGAADGAGLGHRFLRHLQRTRVLLHLVDILPIDPNADPVRDAKSIEAELGKFSEDLLAKPRWLVINKSDLMPDDEARAKAISIAQQLGYKGPLFLIYLCLFGIGLARAFNTPASSALLAQTVPENEFTSAATWSSSAWQFAAIMGPAAAGLLVALLNSVTLVYVFDAVSGLTFLVLVILIQGRQLALSRKSATLESLAEELTGHLMVMARRDADDEALMFGLTARHDVVWRLGTAAERAALTGEMVEVARRQGDRDMEHFGASLRWVSLLEQGDPGYLEQYDASTAFAEREGIPRLTFAALGDLLGEVDDAGEVGEVEPREHDAGVRMLVEDPHHRAAALGFVAPGPIPSGVLLK